MNKIKETVNGCASCGKHLYVDTTTAISINYLGNATVMCIECYYDVEL